MILETFIVVMEFYRRVEATPLQGKRWNLSNRGGESVRLDAATLEGTASAVQHKKMDHLAIIMCITI